MMTGVDPLGGMAFTEAHKAAIRKQLALLANQDKHPGLRDMAKDVLAGKTDLRGGAGNRPYTVLIDGAEVAAPNHCLVQWLRVKHGVWIAELEKPILDDDGIDIDASFRAIKKALVDNNLNFRRIGQAIQPVWEADQNRSLAIEVLYVLNNLGAASRALFLFLRGVDEHGNPRRWLVIARPRLHPRLSISIYRMISTSRTQPHASLCTGSFRTPPSSSSRSAERTYCRAFARCIANCPSDRGRMRINRNDTQCI